MVANIRGYTPNYAFKLVNFDTPRWHTLEYANWTQLDSMLLQAGIPNIRGEWIYSTRYYVGDRVFDSTTGVLYRCLVEHTSAGTGTFADDRALHPTYWTIQTTGVPIFRGQWQTSATYSLGDIVFINAYQYYLCIDSHLSSPAFATDAAKWTLVFDATAAVNTTNANATASSNSASQAATSATNAATSATNAQASAVESAAQAAKLFGTSTSSNTIGLTAKTFVTQANKYFNVGKFIMVRANLDPINNWMWGQVSSYSGTSLVINSITSSGAGTFVDWIIDVSGSRGAIGPQGIQGELGPPLVIKGTVPSAGALPPTGNTIGDMWIATDNQHLYIWDGTQWDDAGPLGTSTTTTADNPPSNPKDGDMWWESDSGIFWVYYDDGNTSQWVQAGGAAASINQNAVLKTGDTMTGDLSINKLAPSIFLDKTTVTAGGLYGRSGSRTMWRVVVGDGGANEAFHLQRYDAAGVFVDSAVVINRTNGDIGFGVGTPNLISFNAPSTVQVLNTTASTTPTTGALTVAGGLGVGGGINATGTIRSFAKSNVLGNPNGAAFNAAVAQADANLLLYDGGGNNWCGMGIDLQGHFWLRTGLSGSPVPTLAITTDQVVRVQNALPSNSPTSGALVVSGGLGVGGNINASSITCDSAGDTIFSYMRNPAPSTGACYVAQNFNPSGTRYMLYMKVANGATVGTITSDGASAAYNTSSGAELKEDLKSFDAGSIIDNTNVYDFAWKSTKERAFGVIAQQAVDVYPLAVTHTEASTEKGAERDEWWGVDYSKYVPVLLQELKALRQRVADLEGRTLDKPVVTTAPRGRK